MDIEDEHRQLQSLRRDRPYFQNADAGCLCSRPFHGMLNRVDEIADFLQTGNLGTAELEAERLFDIHQQRYVHQRIPTFDVFRGRFRGDGNLVIVKDVLENVVEA